MEKKHGFHPEALSTFFKARDAFEEIRDRLQARQQILNVLDYGSGAFGCGRALLGSILKPTNAKVYLYDPEVHIRQSPSLLTEVIDRQGLSTIETLDWINLSYVFSHMQSEQEMRQTLEMLRGQFPEATITVIDYTLRNRTKVDALEILTRSEAERNERILIGDDDRFVDMHARMDVERLHRLARDSGITIANSLPIAADGSHHLIEAEPEHAANSYYTFGG